MADQKVDTGSTAHTVESQHPPAHETPCILVIFGGAGDLSHRKLLPALYNLLVDNQLPEQLAILGFSMEALDDDSYRRFARTGIEQFSRQKIAERHWNKFAALLHFVSGGFSEQGDFSKLRKRLEELEGQVKTGGNRVFYFAVPPAFIGNCADGLSAAGLINPPNSSKGLTRVVIEKPVGRDLASAIALNTDVAEHFDENQIFRIDHYLGKETVENLMVLRFANALFEPIWSEHFIDHVQITAAEQEGVGTRASYYDQAGALRDMVQSHLLQVMCIIAMEPPRSTAADAVRDAKLNVLRSLRQLTDADVARLVVRGQYARGIEDGKPVPAYLDEEHIRPNSPTETFVALKCFIDNWRWAGVPFYLRTGKRMPKRATEVAIYFKEIPRILYNTGTGRSLPPNMLTIQIQPDEGLRLNIVSKLPGSPLRLSPIDVDFHYTTTSPEAYETLLRDVIAGDQTLFMRRDTVEESWRWIQSILDAWAASPLPPALYSAGSWGPAQAQSLIEQDGRSWRIL
jgi:glucose-6-phosphate 1-dehydrogenase